MCTALCVYRLANGPLNNKTPAVATGRLLYAPPSVCTALPVAPQITRLLRWLQTAFCVRLVRANPPPPPPAPVRLVSAKPPPPPARLVHNPPPLCASLVPNSPPHPLCASLAPTPPPPPPCASLAPNSPPPARLVKRGARSRSNNVTTPCSNRHVHSCSNLFHAWFVMHTNAVSAVNIGCTATASHLFHTPTNAYLTS